MFIVMQVCTVILRFNKQQYFSFFSLGIGRAFGIVCAYYHFVLNIPLAKVHYDLAPIRSCGFFDRVFLENAQVTYKKAYE